MRYIVASDKHEVLNVHSNDLPKPRWQAFDAFVHPSPGAKAVILNIPGWRSDINGYDNKYVTLADHLAKTNVAAVIRMPNVERPLAMYRHSLLKDVRAAIEWALNARQDIASPDAAICLMGFSMGAYAAAVVAWEFEDVRKVLLMEPAQSIELVGKLPQKKLASFKGDVHVVVGDKGVGTSGGNRYYKAFTGAASRRCITIENCDHQFTGTRNGMIMSKAPLWALGYDETFPSPEGGLELY